MSTELERDLIEAAERLDRAARVITLAEVTGLSPRTERAAGTEQVESDEQADQVEGDEQAESSSSNERPERVGSGHPANVSFELVAQRHPRRQPERRWLAAAAAVVLVVAGVGLLAIRPDRPDPVITEAPAPPPTDAPAPPPTESPRLLSTVDTLSSTDWVIADQPNQGAEYLWADSRHGFSRVVAYGERRSDGQGEQLSIQVDTFDGPGDDVGDVIDVDGVEWSVQDSPGGRWTAWRALGADTVTVHGPGDADLELLADLVVVDVADLPGPPFGNVDDAIEVVSTELDGVTYTYAVQVSNGYAKTWVTDSSGESGDCCKYLDPDAVLTMDGVGGMSGGDPSGSVAWSSGSVVPAAAQVAVEIADGTIVEAMLSPVDERSGRAYWIVATTIPVMSSTGLDDSFVEVRAYDADGGLIGTLLP